MTRIDPPMLSTRSPGSGGPGRVVLCYRLWAVLWLALVVYGALIPFRFIDLDVAIAQAGGVWPWLLATLTSPQWAVPATGVSSLRVSAAASDLATNLLLLTPFGALAVWGAPRRQASRAVVAAIAIAATVSWSVECLQSLMPMRYASWHDFMANTASAGLGAAVGATLRPMVGPAAFWGYRKTAATRHALHDAGQWLSERPGRAAGAALTLGALVAGSSWVAGRSGVLGGWMPFSSAFAESYDVAAWRLGLTALSYLLLVVAAAGPLAALRARWGWTLLLGVVAGWSLVIEVGHALHGRAAGVTGPILAILVAAAALAAAMLVSEVIRRRDRRRAARPVIVERRRRPHRYHGPDASAAVTGP